MPAHFGRCALQHQNKGAAQLIQRVHRNVGCIKLQGKITEVNFYGQPAVHRYPESNGHHCKEVMRMLFYSSATAESSACVSASAARRAASAFASFFLRQGASCSQSPAIMQP